MTTYSTTNTTDAIIAYKKGITLETVRALRDNPLAMFEGASGAPRLQFDALASSFSTAGGLGSYCFAQGASDQNFGATVAGSTLNPTSAFTSVAAISTDNTVASLNQATALSGTWQAMGKFDLAAVSGSISGGGATLWLRIA